MGQDYFEIFHGNEWLIYGLLVILIVPLLIIGINELLYRLNRREKRLKPPVSLIRNIILPLIAMLIIFTQVIGYSRTSTTVKLIETIVWILIINALLAILNVVFFQGSRSIYAKANVPQLFLDIFRVVMVLLGGAIVLSSVWGVDLGGMMTALGLGSFVLGLALQDTLGNLFSGIALVYEKPFKEGDVITVGDYTGRVMEMNWRAIRLLTREEVLVVIPHLVIGGDTIQNLSSPEEWHILKTNVGFSYATPPNLVKKVIMEVYRATEGILADPAPEVKTTEFADSQIIYELEFAIPEYMQFEEILDDLYTRIWYAAKRNGLHIPFPQVVLNQPREKESLNHEKLVSEFVKELPSHMPITMDEAKNMASQSFIKFYGNNEYIFQKGDQTGILYLIISGKSAITTTSSSTDFTIHLELSRGDFLGEISLFTQQQSLYSMICLEDLVLLEIPSSVVMSLVEKNTRLAHYLDEVMDTRRQMVSDAV